MEILYLLVPLSVVLAFAIGAAFWLAVEGGQFDDLESPGISVLVDDDAPGTATATAIDADQPARGGITREWTRAVTPHDNRSAK